MSNDVKKSVETESMTLDNMGGHILAVPGSATGNITEKRTLPLLYVQSPINKSSSSEGINDSLLPLNVPKLSGPVTVASVTNGVTSGAKLVQVQTPSQNIAYVGTLFKQSNKGKDMVPQKVLLTPVKGKEVSMARLILPRPSTPAPQGIVPGKKICRSFVVSPVTQTSLIKTNDSVSGKLIQPNIIRPRGVEAKILTSAIIKPTTVPKTPVPPGLTLVKSSQLQSQPGEKAPMKVILVDMKEEKSETSTDSSASRIVKPSQVNDNFNMESIKNLEDVMTVEDDGEKSLGKSKELETNTTKSVINIKSDEEKTPGENKGVVQWDEKESNNSSYQSTVDRARKRKGSLLSSISGTPKKILIGDPYENIKLFPGGEDYDPFKIIDWDSQGLGNLPDSSIKVVKNEFDMVELLDNGESADKKKSDEIFCCLSCGCYGLISEFYNENYCSIGCRDELIALQHSIFAKKDFEPDNIEANDKKKSSDNGGMKIAMMTSEIKSSLKSNSPTDKTVPLLSSDTSASLLKSSESDVIDLVEDTCTTSPDSESCVKKVIEESRFTKIKKIISKGYKISRKSDLLKSTVSPKGDKSECKNKIKLRPRSGLKIHKSSSSEDIIAQDLNVGSSNFENDSPKKKSARFRWNNYLSETKSSGAWVKLFNNPFPSKPNRFKVGQRLEAVDPEHQSCICLVSVSEVKGYRLKLHFDGYPKDYDFWVNADSPNLFPSEFCSKHKIPLQLPPGYNMKSFDWDSYLSRHNAKSAPQACFENNSNSMNQVNLFKVDMKLEAVDRKNTFLVCVSTVAAVMENRILVHFDSWDDMYDYWVDISSPYIRPVGWCKNANHELTPPNGIKPDDFCWKKYLKETRSIAAPEKAFVLRPPTEFKKGMKIEAVDKRAPHLVRVASISEVLPYQVKITFDGFPTHFGYWVDDDCPDIHPVGWSSRAGHPLEPPPTEEDFTCSSCPTPGCIGQGFYQGTKKEIHRDIKNCPYTTENLGKDTTLTDRLKWSTKAYRDSDNVIDLAEESAEESEEESEEMKWAWMKMRQSLKVGVRREKGTDHIDNSEENIKNKITQMDRVTSKIKTDEKDSDIKKEDVENDSVDNEECLIKEERASPVESYSNDACDNKNLDDEPSNKILDNESSNKILDDESSNKILDDESNNKILDDEDLNLPIDKKIKAEKIENVKTETRLNGLIEKENTTGQSEIYSEHQHKNRIISSEKDCKPLSFKSDPSLLEESNPLSWSIHQVSKFTRTLISCPKDCFLEEQIDGQGLLMLSKSDLLDCLGLSDSDAEKVYSSINLLRQKAV